MYLESPVSQTVIATVDDVRPGLGLAYCLDDQRCEWCVAAAADALQPGERLALEVHRFSRFALATGYTKPA
jgi:hypothetical protein